MNDIMDAVDSHVLNSNTMENLYTVMARINDGWMYIDDARVVQQYLYDMSESILSRYTRDVIRDMMA